MNAIVNKNRLCGLDTLRASAIILVFMFHYYGYVSMKPTFGFLSLTGWLGVDLFFVLSGYLIGNQILSAIANHRPFSLKTFYYRRLFRTLPVYLFVLGLYFFIPPFRENQLVTPLWKFLTFTQNFNLHGGVAFSQAWSLCIEEQFYLILPAFALLIAWKGSKRIGWSMMLIVLLEGIILRAAYIHHYPHTISHLWGTYFLEKIYYSTFCRLDGLMLGVAVAMVKNFHEDIWSRAIAKGNLFLTIGTLGTVITFYLFLNYHYSFWMITFGFPIIAFSFASLVLAAVSPNSWLYKIHVPGATSIAAWSYAIYLIQKQLMVLTASFLAKQGIPVTSVTTVIVATLVTVFGGWLLYTLIETPFMKLRDKLFEKDYIMQSVIEAKSLKV